MAYFVGLDSGGTKTECWLGDEAQVLARASCGTCKLTRVGQEVATERMRGLLQGVARESGVGLEQVRRTCVGVAGFSIGEVREWAARVVGEMVGGEVEVCGDDEIALEAAFRGGAGVLVIGGTGSAVIGRCADGTRFTAGGWGPGIGDEGSGWWIGREAVRRSFWARDRGVPTGLLDAVREAWGVADVGGVVARANATFAGGAGSPDYSALAPVVVRCAEAGDRVAAAVLERAGIELAEQVGAVWRQMQGRGEKSAEVAFTGSVVEKIAGVRERMRAGVEKDCPGLKVRAEAVHAMEGAMWRARRGSGEG